MVPVSRVYVFRISVDTMYYAKYTNRSFDRQQHAQLPFNLIRVLRILPIRGFLFAR